MPPRSQPGRPDLTGYVPTTFVLRGTQLRVRWLRCAPSEFLDPFFGQTEDRLINRALADTVVETGVDALASDTGDCARAEPAGFIFHTSYCGSTLLSNMLAAVPRHLVLSEPGAVASLMEGVGGRLGADLSPYLPVLRSTMRALGRWGAASANRYFVKFFSQTVHEIDLLRLATPGVPEIFVYRDPLEVLVGNLRSPTQSWIWSQKHTSLPLRDAVERPVVELLARGIGRTMQVMLDHATDSTLLLNYSEIGPTTPRLLLKSFGLPVTDDALCRMGATLAYDAKDVLKEKLFQRDVEEKWASATSRIRDLVSEFAETPFRDLEERRLAQRSASSVRHSHATVGSTTGT